MLRIAAWCCLVLRELLRGAAWCCVVLRGAAWCCVVLRDAALMRDAACTVAVCVAAWRN